MRLKGFGCQGLVVRNCEPMKQWEVLRQRTKMVCGRDMNVPFLFEKKVTSHSWSSAISVKQSFSLSEQKSLRGYQTSDEVLTPTNACERCQFKFGRERSMPRARTNDTDGILNDTFDYLLTFCTPFWRCHGGASRTV